MIDRHNALPVDYRLGEYETQTVLGGGFGVTYKAHDHCGLARLDHLHINKVHRYFQDNGAAYLALKYVEGDLLSELRNVELLKAIDWAMKADTRDRAQSTGGVAGRCCWRVQ